MNELILRDTPIGSDEHGNINLYDLWVMGGSPPAGRPADWRRIKSVKAIEAALKERVCNKHPSDVFVTVGAGRAGRTYAHPVLALAYAEYLSPNLGVEVREVFLRYRAGDVTLAAEIVGSMFAQLALDESRIEMRDTLRVHNRLAAEVAKDAGVKSFEAYNGAGLKALYGMTKAELLVYKGLAGNVSHLDHAGHAELSANYFKAAMSAELIRKRQAFGQKAANAVHREVGDLVRTTIEMLGGDPPEDMPVLDHIREAKKRLRLMAAGKEKPGLTS